MLRSVFQCTDEGAKTDGATAKEKHGAVADVFRIQVFEGIGSSEVPRRKDIRHENQFLLVDCGWRWEKRGIGERNPHILGLATVQYSCSEQLGLSTSRGEPTLAEEAISTADREGRDHSVALFEPLHVRSDLHNLASEFMAHYVARAGGLMASKDVQLTNPISGLVIVLGAFIRSTYLPHSAEYRT